MTTKQRPFVEGNCTIEHDGRTFEAGGSYIDDRQLIAYLGPCNNPLHDNRPDSHLSKECQGDMTTWHGDSIGSYRVTSTWKVGRHGPTTMAQAVVVLKDGRVYTGRGQGFGCSYRGKRAAFDRKG